jgi:hypothetical protein
MFPGSWGTYRPPGSINVTFVGTFGFFMMLFLLFLRFLPCHRHRRSEGRAAAVRTRTKTMTRTEKRIQEEDLMATPIA